MKTINPCFIALLVFLVLLIFMVSVIFIHLMRAKVREHIRGESPLPESHDRIETLFTVVVISGILLSLFGTAGIAIFNALSKMS